MRESTSIRETVDTGHVTLENDEEILYWSNRFSVSEGRLRAAVEKVGSRVEAVAEALKG